MTLFRKNLVANYIGRGWTAFLSILLVPLYIDFLGIEAYGLIGIFTTLLGIMGILDLGLGNTVNRELAKSKVTDKSIYEPNDIIRTFELFYWIMAVLSGALIVLGSGFLAKYWMEYEVLTVESVRMAIIYMGITIVFRFPMTLYQAGLMGLQNQVLVNKILLISGTLRGGGAILALWLVEPTIEVFFIWQMIVSLITTLVFLVALWRQFSGQFRSSKFDQGVIIEVWRYALSISLNSILGICLTQLDKVVLSKMLPLEMFSYYMVAATVASSVWMVILPFNHALFPQLVTLYEEKVKSTLISSFHQSSQILTLILVPVCAVIIFFSKELLMLWLNDAKIVENTYMITSILVLGTMINGLTSAPVSSATAFGWPMLITSTNLIQVVIVIPMLFLMITWLGPIGAAITWVILNLTYFIYTVPRFFKRYLKCEMKHWYLFDIIAPTLVGFAICFVSVLLRPSFDSVLKNFIWLLITGGLTIFFTGLVLPFFRITLKKLKLAHLITKVCFKYKL